MNAGKKELEVRTETFQVNLIASHGASLERVQVHHAVSLPYTQCEPTKTIEIYKPTKQND
jgi:hypothetical protein